MEFEFQLFIRQHHDDWYTVEVVGESGLRIHCQDLAQAREDLDLVLGDRLERYHPRQLARYASSEPGELHTLELAEALPVTASEGQVTQPTQVAVVVRSERGWQRAWLPRWHLRAWVPNGEDLDEALRELLAGHLRRLSPDERLRLRWQGEERLESLRVEAQPASLLAFAGPLRNREILPERRPPSEDADDDDDEQAQTDNRDQSESKRRKSPPTPTFRKIGIDLAKLAELDELERAHGRGVEVTELRDLLHVARGPSGGAYVVLGAPGVGKTSVLNELVHQLRSPNCPPRLQGRRVWFADASRLVAGDGMFGDWQQQVLSAARECVDANLIWFIGNVADLLDAGKAYNSQHNVAALLEPLLASGRMTVVGECTPEAWAQVERRNAGFAAAFGVYRLTEPEADQRRALLDALADELGETTGVTITAPGRRAIIDLCRRYATVESSQVGAALAFTRRMVAHRAAAMRRGQGRASVTLGRSDVVEYFCQSSGLPSFLVRDDLPLDPQEALEHFRSRLLGQSAVIDRMVDLVAAIKAGLGDDTRPLGSFLFVGPTGVGKTETAKALAEYLFGSADRMVRFDLSEFMAPTSVTRLIGDQHQEGRLVAAVRASPFCVVLLDEIEKAHPAVFDVLLQVLGEARLTDRRGRQADFRNVVLLMTSNLGVEGAGPGPGLLADSGHDAQRHFEEAAREFFRPEFLNRIDRILAFSPLELPAITAIAARELEKFRTREGVAGRKLLLDLAPEVGPWLAQRGVDPRYGARPLKRELERRLAVPLARHLSERASTIIRVEPGEEQLEFAGQDAGRSQQRRRAEAIDKQLERTRELRRQVQRWRSSPTLVRLQREDQLLERLSRDASFWARRTWAEERMRRAEAPRDVLANFAQLYQRLCELEDIGFEIAFTGDESTLETCRAEAQQLEAQLESLEWQALGLRFEKPELALLVCRYRERRHGLDRLLKIYVQLAIDYGWTLRVRAAEVIDENLGEMGPDSAAPPPSRKSKKAQRKGNDGPQTPPDPWRWQPSAILLYSPKATEREANPDSIIRRLPSFPETKTYLFEFSGPRAAAKLSGETGLHTFLSANHRDEVDVLALPGVGTNAAPSPRAAKSEMVQSPVRIVDIPKNVAHDLAVDARLPLLARMHRNYEKFMRYHLYRHVFGGHRAYLNFRR